MRVNGLGLGLSHEDGHPFTAGKGGGQHGGKLAAVGDDAFDVELVDVVLDLLAGADDQDLDAVVLGVIVAKIGQQFVELCGHGNLPCLLQVDL